MTHPNREKVSLFRKEKSRPMRLSGLLACLVFYSLASLTASFRSPANPKSTCMTVPLQFNVSVFAGAVEDN